MLSSKQIVWRQLSHRMLHILRREKQYVDRLKPNVQKLKQGKSREKAENNDFKFLKESVTQSNVPDYDGFNNKMNGDEGEEMKAKSNILYKPLIDKKPADPSTVLIAMHSVEMTCTESGQEFTVFTCDQQLYRITLDIIWNEPERWKNFYPRLGGMHMLMNFIGSIGKLMDGSGLDKLMAKAFGGVDVMLQGKKYPMNLRALRFVVLELLHDILIEANSNANSNAFYP